MPHNVDVETNERWVFSSHYNNVRYDLRRGSEPDLVTLAIREVVIEQRDNPDFRFRILVTLPMRLGTWQPRLPR